tara:strand:- start:1525 stop:2187 length:663 start_codon:yes stop_codon:yes gene_type:complete
MIEAHVVTTRNRHLYKDEFEEFLRRRHEYYAVANRWVPISDDGLELDPFDTPHATYMLGILGDRVVTSARLMPTSQPNLVSEEFPHMCENIGLPRREDWADWTRTYVLPEYRGVGSTGILGQMFCAVMEYCVEEGITHIGGVLQQYLLKRWLDMGWTVIPAGLPRVLSGDWCLVAYIEVNERALATGREHASVTRPLIVRRGAQLPFIEPSRRPAIEANS